MRIIHKSPEWFIRWLNFKNRIARYLPPKGSRIVSIGLCKFRLMPKAPRHGGYGGYGISYQWLGVSLNVNKEPKPVTI